MLLAIDIGNSNIHIGYFENDKLICKFDIGTKSNYSDDEYALYTDADLPMSLNYNSKEIFVNNIEYIFCGIDEDTCTFCISLDLISDYNVEDFKIAFSLIGENTNTVREYVLEDINVYGFEGNYISLDGDFKHNKFRVDANRENTFYKVHYNELNIYHWF